MDIERWCLKISYMIIYSNQLSGFFLMARIPGTGSQTIGEHVNRQYTGA